ncbi:hypothetical protein [uncultured Tateyamaria sp.]|uniref:hypothetical protein n=1 Tax=uncultured Tateyamaria sp. TaxID=455651 RepID=UPI002611E9D8|nr:hypothetical protein [uncultured Tateyamaria sp.]
MNDTIGATPANVQAARDSFNGRGLTETQFREGWAIAGVLHAAIHHSGSFREKLTDYAHVYARDEKFDALKGEAILRDLYQGRYDQTLNATREALQTTQEALPETAQARVLAAADGISVKIKEGPTQPFYQAYDKAAVSLSQELGITQKGAKSLMQEAFKAQHGRDLYKAGKEVEEAYHKPVRAAEIAARKAEKLEAPGQQQRMG